MRTLSTQRPWPIYKAVVCRVACFWKLVCRGMESRRRKCQHRFRSRPDSVLHALRAQYLVVTARRPDGSARRSSHENENQRDDAACVWGEASGLIEYGPCVMLVKVYKWVSEMALAVVFGEPIAVCRKIKTPTLAPYARGFFNPRNRRKAILPTRRASIRC